jgi:hypothetical protein
MSPMPRFPETQPQHKNLPFLRPKSMSKFFCFAANGPISREFRSENAHVALFCPGLSGYTPLFVPHSLQIGFIFA